MIHWNDRIFEAAELKDLENIATRFVEDFPLGGVFRVHGEMAAGKTTFISRICYLLGIEHTSSPTFSIVNEYRTQDHQIVFHFDLYRLRNERELMELGFEDYFLQKPYFVFIEWPEIAKHLIPDDSVDLYLSRI
jgi:tRNA threonylcarbamoyladenosine biosynthesis protein TsaE